MRIDQLITKKHDGIIRRAARRRLRNDKNADTQRLVVEPDHIRFSQLNVEQLPAGDLDFGLSLATREPQLIQIGFMNHEMTVEACIDEGSKTITTVGLLNPKYRAPLVIYAPDESAQSPPPTVIGPSLW